MEKNEYMKLMSVVLATAIFMLSACTSFGTDDRLEEALSLAGENRGELEKVLDHYVGDTLKYEAARFLIANMPGHYSYADTNVVISYSHAVDSILLAMKDSASAVVRDSINACAVHYKMPEQKKVQDINIMTSKYLIANIEDAFGSWQKGMWAQHLSFEDFCEYLLPYKVEELQLLDNWRGRLRKFHADKLKELEWCDNFRNSTLEASRLLSRVWGDLMHPNYDGAIKYSIMKWETNANVPFGTCDYYAPIAMALFRSSGIPIGFDFTPHWAGRRLGHSWNFLIAENGHNYTFNGIISSPGDAHNLAEKMVKVYRHTYAANPELIELNRSEKYVPRLFKSFFLKDVTKDYMSAVDVTISSSAIPDHRGYVFLSIFGEDDWTPIAFGRVDGRNVSFKNIGRNALYMPFSYGDKGNLVSIGAPFIVQSNGSIRKIEADSTKRITLEVKRKYPVLEYVYRWLGRLDSCEFQASNDSTFATYQLVHRIDDCHGTGYDIKVSDSIAPYRYWRFFSTKSETHANIAELYFFDQSDRQIKGRPIGTSGSWADIKECTKEAAFDGDILSFFDAPDGDGSWVGVDFGKPRRVSHFYYYGRGDGNAIEPYDTYELLCWDNGHWKSLGVRKACAPTLKFDNVPSGGVYLLRNLTKGHEERVFTYEGGKQVWW